MRRVTVDSEFNKSNDSTLRLTAHRFCWSKQYAVIMRIIFIWKLRKFYYIAREIFNLRYGARSLCTNLVAYTLYMSTYVCMYVCSLFWRKVLSMVFIAKMFSYEMCASLQNYILLIRQMQGQKKIWLYYARRDSEK